MRTLTPWPTKLGRIVSLTFALALSSCGGGGGGGSSAPPPPSGGGDSSPTYLVSTADATRFLRQASFGPTPDSVERVRTMGFDAWIDEQMTLPATGHLSYMDSLPEPADLGEARRNRLDAWFQASLTGQDQLRQRVAYALSQIMVVSDQSVLINFANGLGYYYDRLAGNAFGQYRTLLEDVTLSPAMGLYLSMLGNEKPDVARNIRPDENYAREVMQLFSIGLVELNTDGSAKRDANGNPIPTYDQAVIEGFAHVFTGWTFANSPSWNRPSYLARSPMQAFPAYHDSGEKRLLNNVTLPAGQTPEQDLSMALDALAEHPNVAPFISLRLIQQLVTANPSPAYLERISTVFNDDGTGQRGNLAAVVKAILLDDEARIASDSETAGKIVEPLLRFTSLLRAFDAKSESGRYTFRGLNTFLGQEPLSAPSVFNFYSPFYSPPGELGAQGLRSPELQMANEASVAQVNSYLAYVAFLRNHTANDVTENDTLIDLSDLIDQADNPAALLDAVHLRLIGNPAGNELAQESLPMIEQWNQPAARVAEAVHAVITSIDYATLR